MSDVEKALNKEIAQLKKSSWQFLKEFIKDITLTPFFFASYSLMSLNMIPYMQIHSNTCKIKPQTQDIRRDVLTSLNYIFRSSFEGMYLEWVLVKRTSFAQYHYYFSLPPTIF